ncbi:Dimerisation domain-containing protein [Rhodospirillales bacterium URHD0017]|nr:Dimerisation domain-containing protein [Rhodospirillales bacterium URHD0017]
MTSTVTQPKQPATGEIADVSPDAIVQLGLGFWGSKALLSAVELGLFTELASGPLDLAALTKRLRLHQRSARDFLDALLALGMLQRNGERYANTPATDRFLDHRKPGYIGGLLEMANARLYPFWGSLTEALRTGDPQNEAKQGRDLFDELYNDPQRLAEFLKAMTGLSLGSAAVIANKFPWADCQTFADIGAAQGGLAVTLARTHAHLSGIGFDLPVVRPHFEAFVAEQGLSGRLAFRGGDFFADPLPTADVLVMGHILHDWGFEKKRLLIDKAYQALPYGGALIVYETIIDDERRNNAFGLLMSLNMLIETREGFDYTGKDCMGWMKETGFAETRVETLAGPDSMVIGIK